MSELVLQNLKDGVLLLTLNRPERKNALTNEMLISLQNAMEAADQNSDVRVVVLTGADGNFSSGADLSTGAQVVSNDDKGQDQEQPYEICAKSIAAFSKPLLASAAGLTIGGGATMTFLCDLLYVGDDLRMKLPFVSLGLTPELGSTYLLQANIGRQRAAELMFTAQWINAQLAVDYGIAAASFSADSVLSKTMEKAAEMAQWPVNSLIETKRCLKAAHNDAVAQAFEVEHIAMAKQSGSAENIEAFTAFLEKRKPDFHGRK